MINVIIELRQIEEICKVYRSFKRTRWIQSIRLGDFRVAYSLLLLLLEKVASLHDTRVEERPILHDKLDILDGQVDQHASDLRSLWSHNLGDVLVEDSADLILVVGVLGYDSRDDRVTGHQVALLERHLSHLLLLLLLLLLHHLLLLHLLHLSLVVLARRLNHLLLSCHTIWIATVVSSDVLLTRLTTLMTTISTWSSTRTHRALILLHKVRHGFKKHLEIEL